jgi:hypothetical protein
VSDHNCDRKDASFEFFFNPIDLALVDFDATTLGAAVDCAVTGRVTGEGNVDFVDDPGLLATW